LGKGVKQGSPGPVSEANESLPSHREKKKSLSDQPTKKKVRLVVGSRPYRGDPKKGVGQCPVPSRGTVIVKKKKNKGRRGRRWKEGRNVMRGVLGPNVYGGATV